MNQTKFKCKIITPMFMVGGDGITPELRPSEFKGMMRFWWRAIKAEEDVQKLKREEAKIFGGTGEGEGKSKFSIKINYDEEKLKKFIGKDLKKNYNLDWRYIKEKNTLEGKDSGIGYLLYSTTLPKREREFIKDGFDFNLEISCYDENILIEVLASFWLAIYLGGFGTRARRGGGNIVVKEVEGDTAGINFRLNEITEKNLKNWLQGNLDKIKSIIQSQGTNKYSNLKDARIIISTHQNSWKDALNEIGSLYKNFRVENKSDIWGTSAFGMPVMHDRGTTRMVPYFNQDRLSERRASSLIIKIINSGELYFPMVIKLSGDIVLNREVGKENKHNKKWSKASKTDIKKVNDQKINDFLNLLPNKIEVQI